MVVDSAGTADAAVVTVIRAKHSMFDIAHWNFVDWVVAGAVVLVLLVAIVIVMNKWNKTQN